MSSQQVLTYSDWAFIRRLMQPVAITLDSLKKQCAMAERNFEDAKKTVKETDEQLKSAEEFFCNAQKELAQTRLRESLIEALPNKCEEKYEAARVRMNATLRVFNCALENQDAAKEFFEVMQKALSEFEDESPIPLAIANGSGILMQMEAQMQMQMQREMKLLPYILPLDTVFYIGDHEQEATFTMVGGAPCFEYRGALYNNPTALVDSICEGPCHLANPWEVMRVAHYDEFKNMTLSEVYDMCAAGARQIMKEES